jgi:hypothetical protein
MRMAPTSRPPIDSEPHRRPKLQFFVSSNPSRKTHATRTRRASTSLTSLRWRVVANSAGVAFRATFAERRTDLVPERFAQRNGPSAGGELRPLGSVSTRASSAPDYSKWLAMGFVPPPAKRNGPRRPRRSSGSSRLRRIEGQAFVRQRQPCSFTIADQPLRIG